MFASLDYAFMESGLEYNTEYQLAQGNLHNNQSYRLYVMSIPKI